MKENKHILQTLCRGSSWLTYIYYAATAIPAENYILSFLPYDEARRINDMRDDSDKLYALITACDKLSPFERAQLCIILGRANQGKESHED